MSQPETVQLGDTITVQHASGLTRTVKFEGFYGKNLTMAYVAWGGMAGQYRVLLTTGQLTPKKASLWRVIDEDLARLQIARKAELRAAAGRVKDPRYGKDRGR